MWIFVSYCALQWEMGVGTTFSDEEDGIDKTLLFHPSNLRYCVNSGMTFYGLSKN